jgi:hypothetical protein
MLGRELMWCIVISCGISSWRPLTSGLELESRLTSRTFSTPSEGSLQRSPRGVRKPQRVAGQNLPGQSKQFSREKWLILLTPWSRVAY